ncbi:MAG TPA: hypothetical protein VHB21_06900, partial [Minicystis sp.]|nr:hypothetical protein [Minicystis sp.]
AGYPARLFVKKTEELARRLAEVAPALLAAPPLDVRLGDARALAGVAAGSVALVVTSPPYPGNYDYLAHHAARLRWLGLDAQPLERAEIGARRNLEPLGLLDARRVFEADLAASLAAAARALRPSGRAALLVADSVVAGRALYALDVVTAAARRAALSVVATASQPRPHFHAASRHAFAGRPRAEHVVLLARDATTAPPLPGRRARGERS